MVNGIQAVALGPVAVAARAFCLRGRSFLTVIVKATFALSQDAAMELVKPNPMVWREQHRAERPLSSVRHASDVALVVPQAELIVDAIAFSGGPPVERLSTRIAVARGTSMLVSKHL